MGTYSAAQLKAKLATTDLRVHYADGWDSAGIDPFGRSPSAGVMMHHTANGGARGNNPSLYWQINNQYAPVRAAHCNIGRDGLVTIIAARGSYHAGASNLPAGGMQIGRTWVSSASGNRDLFGIEIESKGTNPTTKARVSDVDGYTPEQIAAATTLAAAMCELMGVGAKTVLNHKDWAPRRKNDTLLTRAFWQRRVRRKMLANRVRNLVPTK